MRYILFTMLVSLTICVSCNKTRNKDQSLSIEEYQDLGMPDYKKTWGHEEFDIAKKILSEIKWTKPFQLPAKDSKKSGPLFNRIISLDNMTFLKDQSLALNEKAMLSLDFLVLFENWIDIYTDPRMKKQYYHRELIDININNLRLTQIMLDLGEKIRQSDDPLDIMMSSGFPSIRENHVAVLQNLLDLSANPSQFLATDLEVLSDSISASIIRNRDWMDSVETKNLKGSLSVAIDSASSDYVRNNYIYLSELF